MGSTLRNYDHLTWKLPSSYDAQTITQGHDAVSETGASIRKDVQKVRFRASAPNSAFPRRSDHDFDEISGWSPRNYNHDTAKFEVPTMSRKMSLTSLTS
jgi:hypothetical protein